MGRVGAGGGTGPSDAVPRRRSASSPRRRGLHSALGERGDARFRGVRGKGSVISWKEKEEEFESQIVYKVTQEDTNRR